MYNIVKIANKSNRSAYLVLTKLSSSVSTLFCVNPDDDRKLCRNFGEALIFMSRFFIGHMSFNFIF